MKIIVFVLVLLTLSSTSALAKTGIIILPGLLESHLKSVETGERKFLSLKDIYDESSLVLNSGEIGVKDVEELVPDGIFDSLELTRRLKVDFMGDLIEASENLTEENSEYEVHLFPFDWRKGIDELAAKLRDYLKSQEQIKKWIAIGHSMGGLVISYFIRYGGQPVATAKESWEGLSYISKFISAGTPFKGSIFAFREQVRGRPSVIDKSKFLFSPLGAGSFTSFYYLFPHSNKLGILDKDYKNINSRVYTVEKFMQEEWGLFHYQCTDEVKKMRKQYVETQLRKARKFHELMEAPMQNQPMQKLMTLMVRGKNLKTIENVIHRKIKRQGKKNLTATRFETLSRKDHRAMFNKGDGVVSLKSSVPPVWLKQVSLEYEPYWSKGTHIGILSNEKNLEKIMDFIEN